LTETVEATFLILSDTPASYTGHASKKVKVKADETGLEFIAESGGSESTTSLGILIGSADDATPNDSDYVATALTGGGILKKITWTNVKAFLKTYFDTLYAAALGVDDNYVTDAQLVVIGNTSNTNTGDNATNTQYSGLAASKQDALISGTNIKTINGSTILGTGDLTVSGSMPRGHIWGLIMSNAADTANDITIATGEARNEANTGDMILDSAITKQIDAAWAVGTNAGGLNTGAVADNTWYEVHLIKRVDTNVVDVMFTTTANRTTLPTNYTLSRRIGWVRRATGTLLQFTQVENHFTLTTPVNDVSATATATATARTLTSPPSTIARFRASCLGNTSVNAANAIVFSEIVETDTAPTTTNGFNSIGSGDFAIQGAGHFELRVSSTSTIRDRAITATGTMAYDISTFGWIDNRTRFSNI